MLPSPDSVLPRAIDPIQAAICAEPETAQAYVHWAWLAIEQGRSAVAERSLARAIAVDPRCFEAWRLRALQAWQEGNPEQALVAAEQALAIDPNSAELLALSGTIYYWRGDLSQAKAANERAIGLDPSLHYVWTNLGVVYGDLGAFDEADACHRRCVAALPDLAEAWYHWGNLYSEVGRDEAAIERLERAVALKPDWPIARLNLALSRLRSGDWLRGLREYEARFLVQPNLVLPNPFRRWQGEPIVSPPRSAELADPNRPPAVTTLLIESEQGFGDALQFIRYAAWAADRFDRVFVRCRSELADLLATAPGVTAVFSEAEPLPIDLINPIDGPDSSTVTIPMVSLAGLAATTPATVPDAVPYLAVPDRTETTWLDRLGLGVMGTPIEPGSADRSGSVDRSSSVERSDPTDLSNQVDRSLDFGLVWASGQRQGRQFEHDQTHRSLSIDDLATLLRKLGQMPRSPRLWSLQVGQPAREWQALGQPDDRDLSPHLTTFAQTAAAIDRLAGIITVDTAVAHLAGAMAKPVWLLLPEPADWRWLRSIPNTPWYPTMRLIRQTRSGDWSGAIDQLVSQISSLLLP